MRLQRVRCQWLWILCLLLAASACGQTPPLPDGYKPVDGQAGKDVPWVPTPHILADRMLALGGVSAQDYVIDLGSGDGRIVIAAAKRGARALGIEYDPNLVALSQRTAEREGVGTRARFVQGDIFQSDFSQATVVTLFLLPELYLRLRPAILDLRPGTRILSHYFGMGEWEPDQRLSISRAEGCPQWHCEALFWVVPARVEGRWRLPGGELAIEQAFQAFSGTLTAEGGGTKPVTNGRISGDRIAFTVGQARYTGLIEGGAMKGTIDLPGGESADWQAALVR